MPFPCPHPITNNNQHPINLDNLRSSSVPVSRILFSLLTLSTIHSPCFTTTIITPPPLRNSLLLRFTTVPAIVSLIPFPLTTPVTLCSSVSPPNNPSLCRCPPPSPPSVRANNNFHILHPEFPDVVHQPVLLQLVLRLDCRCLFDHLVVRGERLGDYAVEGC